jgi:hypothetical protein
LVIACELFRRHIDAVWRHKMNGNEDMNVVFVVNYMQRQHIAVEFLYISLVYGADIFNWKSKNKCYISYCLFDNGMTVRDSNNKVSTASGSQPVWTHVKSALKCDDEPVVPNSFYTASLDEVIETLTPLQMGNYHMWLCWSNQAMVQYLYN